MVITQNHVQRGRMKEAAIGLQLGGLRSFLIISRWSSAYSSATCCACSVRDGLSVGLSPGGCFFFPIFVSHGKASLVAVLQARRTTGLTAPPSAREGREIWRCEDGKTSHSAVLTDGISIVSSVRAKSGTSQNGAPAAS